MLTFSVSLCIDAHANRRLTSNFLLAKYVVRLSCHSGNHEICIVPSYVSNNNRPDFASVCRGLYYHILHVLDFLPRHPILF